MKLKRLTWLIPLTFLSCQPAQAETISAEVTKMIFGCVTPSAYEHMEQNINDSSYVYMILRNKTCEGIPTGTHVQYEVQAGETDGSFVKIDPYGLYTRLIVLKSRSKVIDTVDQTNVSNQCEGCTSL